MFIWMVYVIVVTLLLSAAAFCAERAFRVGGGTSRWIWLISIVASLLVPVVISSVSIQVPSIVTPPADITRSRFPRPSWTDTWGTISSARAR